MTALVLPTRAQYISNLQSTHEGQRSLCEFTKREIVQCVSCLIGTMAQAQDSDISREMEEADIMEAKPDYKEAAQEDGYMLVKHDGSYYSVNSKQWDRMMDALRGIKALDQAPDAECEAVAEALDDLGELLDADDEDTAWIELCDTNRIEPHRREVYEHWIITSWLAKKLAAYGEATGDVFGLVIWGRTCSGQAIASDNVIAEIYADLHDDQWRKENATN